MRRYDPARILLACYVLAGGVISFLGWAANIPALTSWHGDGISIQPNTTVAVMLTGAALLAIVHGYHATAHWLGLAVALIGGSVIVENLTGLDFGIDTPLLFGRTWGQTGVLSPGRMGPSGATSWTIMGVALMLASLPIGSRSRRAAPTLAIFTGSLSALAIIGYLYGASPLYAIPTLTIIALQTATFIVAASVAVVLSVPESGPMRFFTQDNPAGVFARRIAPAVFFVPVILGLIRLMGERAGLYDTAFGSALRTVCEIGLFMVLVWWTGRAVNRQFAQRVAVDRALGESRSQLEDELQDSRLLQRVSTELLHQDDPQHFYDSIMEAAVSIMRSDFASMQMFHPDRGEHGQLVLIANRAFPAEAAEYWRFVDTGSECTCGAALASGKRTIVPDIEQCEFIVGTQDAEMYRQSGIRACQSTPLVSRTGALVGMISTHWRDVHHPTERSLRLMDILARQAADLIERRRSETTIGALNAQLNVDLVAMTRMHEISTRLLRASDVTTLLEEILDAAIEITGASKGTIQLLEQAALKTAAHRGFENAFLEMFSALEDDTSICAKAMRAGQRVVVVDVTDTSEVKSSTLLEGMLSAGARAVQCTPLISRSGNVLGTLSTLYEAPHMPIERELRAIDVLARQAADLLERKRSELQREDLLERERAARSEAERAARLKDEFLATLSHELRTPLNAVVGWSRLLKLSAEDPDKVKHAADVIERNAKLQSQLISDLLDMSRISAGKMRVEVKPVDLAAIVGEAIDSVQLAADAKGVSLSTRTTALHDVVFGDAAKLLQVVWNLLSNAVKFTPPGGSVEVELKKRDANVVIAVTDSGEGIDPEFLPHIFERFRQGDASTSRRHGGLGLGLAIVKHLTELHGGRVEVTSNGVGKGARFSIELPREHAGTLPWIPEIGRTPMRLPPLKNVKVLVIDDEPDSLEMVRRILEECEAEVTTATGFVEALGALASEQFDVIVSDLGMPDRDGYELLGEVRARGIATPAIALTAFARAEDRARALAVGYQAHIAKPVETGDLIALVASLGRGKTPSSGPLSVH